MCALCIGLNAWLVRNFWPKTSYHWFCCARFCIRLTVSELCTIRECIVSAHIPLMLWRVEHLYTALEPLMKHFLLRHTIISVYLGVDLLPTLLHKGYITVLLDNIPICWQIFISTNLIQEFTDDSHFDFVWHIGPASFSIHSGGLSLKDRVDWSRMIKLLWLNACVFCFENEPQKTH